MVKTNYSSLFNSIHQLNRSCEFGYRVKFNGLERQNILRKASIDYLNNPVKKSVTVKIIICIRRCLNE